VTALSLAYAPQRISRMLGKPLKFVRDTLLNAHEQVSELLRIAA